MKKNLTKPQIRLVGTIIVLALSAILYKALVLGKLEQTSALFIGIPTVLAIGFSLLPPSKSMTGTLLKGTLIALMMSGIVLSEGFICIAMATPLFALIAVIIGFVIDRSKRKNSARLMSLVFFLPLAMEGVLPDFEFERYEVVRATQTIPISVKDIKSQLRDEMVLTQPLPIFLRLGFPTASEIKGTGLEIGSQRCIYFSGGEGEPGELCLVIVEISENLVKFRMLKDESHISHWLAWKDSTVEWSKRKDGRFDVSWTLAYERKLDPAWYFAPFERYGAQLAAEYLLNSYFRN